jgi:hypothetical protein
MKLNANIIEHKVDGKQQSVTRIKKNINFFLRKRRKFIFHMTKMQVIVNDR